MQQKKILILRSRRFFRKKRNLRKKNMWILTIRKKRQRKKDIGLTVSMPRKYFNEQALARLKNLVSSKQTLIKKALGIEELPIKVGDEKVSFPWFEVKPTDEDAVTAYSHLIYALCEMAKNQNRITAIEKEVEREK